MQFLYLLFLKEFNSDKITGTVFTPWSSFISAKQFLSYSVDLNEDLDSLALFFPVHQSSLPRQWAA